MPATIFNLTCFTAGRAVMTASALWILCEMSVQGAAVDETAQNVPPPAKKSYDVEAARARWRAQQIMSRRAEAEYQNARLTREIAEIAVLEYQEGIFMQDMATIEGEIKLAQSDLERAADRRDWARRMFDKGFVSKAVKTAEELSLRKATFSLEQAQAKKKVLIEYTKNKTLKELRSEVSKARSNELAKKATWEREKSKESAFERAASP